jgi:hypothetical protein
LNPDSSEDSELKIKGLPNIEISDFSREELEPENNLGSFLEVDIVAVHSAQAKYAQRVAQTQARRTRKITKNNKRVKAGKAFPEYTDQNREDYNPYNLPDAITGEKDPEGKSSDNDKEHDEVTTLGRICTRS